MIDTSYSPKAPVALVAARVDSAFVVNRDWSMDLTSIKHPSFETRPEEVIPT